MTKPQAVVALLDLVEDLDLGPGKDSPAFGTWGASGFTTLPSAADEVRAVAVVVTKTSTEPAPTTPALPDISTGTETGSQQNQGDLL